MLVLLPLLWGCSQSGQNNAASTTDNAGATDELMTKASSMFKVLPAIAENPENPIPEGCIYTPGYAYDIIPMGDTEAIRSVLEGYLEKNMCLESHMKKSCDIAKYLGWEESASKYISIYKDVISGRNHENF